MPIIEWDNDGYPTDESLEKLKKVLNSENIKEAFNAFYEALKENFYHDCCGLTEVEVRGDVIDVWEYHTLGWSGNEDIINVLAESWLWGMLLERYDSGGHYYFKVEK